MKTKIILLASLILLTVGCSEDESDVDNGPKGTVNFMTRGLSDGGDILVFRKHLDNLYKYTESFSPTWIEKFPAPADGKQYEAEKKLQFGDYEFLFYKMTATTNTTLPSLTPGSTQMDNLLFSAKGDGVNGAGYYLPVDEIWLPETSIKAHTKYHITGIAKPLVSARLVRAVSQVEIVLRRAKNNSGTIIPEPFVTGDISDIISSVTLEVDKLGTSVDFAGAGQNANAKTKVTLFTSAATIDSDGFATLNGPFVFPSNISGGDVTFDLSLGITPAESVKYPGPYNITNKPGNIERNRKMQIIVWFTASETPSVTPISIEVEYGDLGDPVAGDTGTWD